jgi:hypothetical protein
VALLVSGVVVLIIGENPLEAMWIMLKGAVGSIKGWGYLLYYATNFIFTGLAVAVAFHAGLFNIGGEGQAYFAGLGATIGLVLRIPALAPAHSAGHPHLCPIRRLLGLCAGIPAGQARQPHRHHHNHVQLHRLQPDGLHHQLLAPACGQDGGGKPRHRQLRRQTSPAPISRASAN